MNTTPKVALVTGASSGFGQATAARLSRQFAHLRSPDRQCICQGYRVARSLHEALPTSDLSLLPKKGH